MAFQGIPVLGLLVLLVLLTNGTAVSPSLDTSSLNRTSFPKGFVFGTAAAAYQYEGAAKEGGKEPSIWDTFTHRYPGKIKGGSNGDVAIDQYHHYKGDVRIMKKIGLDAYRFSISWSRVVPKGKLSRGVNKEGIKYYNKLINKLLARGLQPFVTLFHWDLPQALEDEYGGFLSPHIVDDFRDYSEFCFKEFGDRVKHWITLNEPYSYVYAGYVEGKFAPGRCSSWQQLNCTGGDSAIEPYLASHNLLLAHASAVKVYKQKYQEVQKGIMGISLNTDWFVPFSNVTHDHDAALRALDFMFGWFMDPLTNGDYPHIMRSLVGDRLPKFTKVQSKIVKGSLDFLGLNYYTAKYVADSRQSKVENASYLTDSRTNTSSVHNGIPIGPKLTSDWIHVYPRGIQDALLYTKTKYNNPLIFITENGIDEFNNATLPLKEALADNSRIDYHYLHFQYIHRAIKDGVNVKGYFVWSLLDNFEWSSGYTVRFGINYVDYKNGLKRHPKLSARWFKKFLKE
nr:beta-glucosidase 12-like [Quercus suber]